MNNTENRNDLRTDLRANLTNEPILLPDDVHMHCEFSGDSETPMEEMIERAIQNGLTGICFTDHYDMDFNPPLEFELDTPAYTKKLRRMQEKYRDQIEIRYGVELGLQTHLSERITEYLKAWPFDQVIGSMHLVDGYDPYYRENFPQYTDEQLYTRYFDAAVENLKGFHDFDVFGHVDYVVRYGYTKAENYSYMRYREVLDEILTLLIRYDIALEINTGGFKYGLGFPNPHPDLIRRYRELGGRMITFGADAHVPEYVGYEFAQAVEIARACGFQEYIVFRNRTPESRKL